MLCIPPGLSLLFLEVLTCQLLCSRSGGMSTSSHSYGRSSGGSSRSYGGYGSSGSRSNGSSGSSAGAGRSYAATSTAAGNRQDTSTSTARGGISSRGSNSGGVGGGIVSSGVGKGFSTGAAAPVTSSKASGGTSYRASGNKAAATGSQSISGVGGNRFAEARTRRDTITRERSSLQGDSNFVQRSYLSSRGGSQVPSYSSSTTIISQHTTVVNPSFGLGFGWPWGWQWGSSVVPYAPHAGPPVVVSPSPAPVVVEDASTPVVVGLNRDVSTELSPREAEDILLAVVFCCYMCMAAYLVIR
jgi:hypothetical protein